MNNFYVYVHRQLNDGTVFYVGKGQNKRAFEKTNHTRWWHNIVKKYGYEVILKFENLDEDTAFQIEMSLIAEHGRRDLGTGTLVNMTNGGEGRSGYVCSPETLAKMSTAQMGKKHSPETLAKIGAANMGRKCPPRSLEHRAKISAAHIGKKRSPETLAKMSAASVGKKISPETRAKLRAAHIGKKLSSKHRAKLRAANMGNTYRLGRKHSPETRAKMSAVRIGKKRGSYKKHLI